METAEQLVDSFEYEKAKEVLERDVLSVQPDNTDALQLYAAVCIELAIVTPAIEALNRVILLNPQLPEPYLALAQLSDGLEALGFYVRGVDLFKHKENLSPDDKTQMSSAMCAVAELYMTDLCDDPEAEAKCRAALDSARVICESNPEIYKVQCDLMLVLGQVDEANLAMADCLAKWADAEAQGKRMSFDFRLSVAKLLIEMQQFERGEMILEGLIEEDDEAVLPWYLLGVSCVQRLDSGCEDPDGDLRETAGEAFKQAERLLLAEPEQDRDCELLDSIRQFLASFVDAE